MTESSRNTAVEETPRSGHGAPLVEPGGEWLPPAGLCPSWCDGEHEEVLEETGDHLAAQQHRRHAGGSGALEELRAHGSRVVRAWGGEYGLELRQEAQGPRGGLVGCPLVHVQVAQSDGSGGGPSVGLDLTSGDARVLAARLLAAADRLDLV